VLLLCSGGLAAGPGAAEAADCLGSQGGRRWRVGIVPQLPPKEIVSTWTPVLKEVGYRSGQCLVLVVAPSIPAFEQQLRSGKLDFAFMNPYHVVRKNSPVRRLADLNGATVAFPAPNAFAASLLLRALLARDGIRITPIYVRTHSNVYRSVILGSSGAGGGVNNTLQRERPEVREQLRVLWRTPAFPAHPFSAAANVPASVRLRMLHSFLELGRTPQGRQLLAKAQLPNVVKADHDRDYAPLTALGLERFVVRDGD
jgi:phosphonate transport system substrate-binding protein